MKTTPEHNERIRKMTFAGAVLVTFSFTACAEKQQEASGTAQDQHEEMDHSGMNHSEMAAKVVVETPDYTSVAEPVKAQVAALVLYILPIILGSQ